MTAPELQGFLNRLVDEQRTSNAMATAFYPVPVQFLTFYTLRSKFEFSFVAPIHFLRK